MSILLPCIAKPSEYLLAFVGFGTLTVLFVTSRRATSCKKEKKCIKQNAVKREFVKEQKLESSWLAREKKGESSSSSALYMTRYAAIVGRLPAASTVESSWAHVFALAVKLFIVFIIKIRHFSAALISFVLLECFKCFQNNLLTSSRWRGLLNYITWLIEEFTIHLILGSYRYAFTTDVLSTNRW